MVKTSIKELLYQGHFCTLASYWLQGNPNPKAETPLLFISQFKQEQKLTKASNVAPRTGDDEDIVHEVPPQI